MASEIQPTLNKIQNSFASKTPPQQPPKRKARVEDERFSCKEKGRWTYNRPYNDRRCFVCKEGGHWYKDCPNKVGKKTHDSSPGEGSGSSCTSVNSLILWCPCGQGACIRLKDSINGKTFYACPAYLTPDDCNFSTMMWSDDVSMFKPPMCPCGAGECSLNGKSSSWYYAGWIKQKSSSWYYACRVKKGQGACKFFQQADPPTLRTNTNRDECKDSPVDNFYKGRPVPKVQIICPAVNRNLIHDFENVSTTERKSGSETRNDETPSINLVAEAPESNALMMRQVPSLPSLGNVCHQLLEFWRQFTAVISQSDSHLLLGLRDCEDARQVWDYFLVREVETEFYDLNLQPWLCKNLNCSLFHPLGAYWCILFAIAIHNICNWRNKTVQAIRRTITAKAREITESLEGENDHSRVINGLKSILIDKVKYCY